MEGNHCYNPETNCKDGTLAYLTFPVIEYEHINGACSVTGSYIYRGRERNYVALIALKIIAMVIFGLELSVTMEVEPLILSKNPVVFLYQVLEKTLKAMTMLLMLSVDHT